MSWQSKLENRPEPTITESIEIDATPEAIWAVLTDFDKLPDWCSSFQGVEGEVAAGKRSTAFFKNPLTGKNMAFEHEVVVFEENCAMGWTGKAFLGRDDFHVYSIEPLANGKSKFIQEDGLYGKPRNFMVTLTEMTIRRAYKQFNKELKARVEG